MIERVHVDALVVAEYNPRMADSARLALVETSLRKLGWLLPIYSTPRGEILSGHQRFHVALEMGATYVPVERISCSTDSQRLGLNLAFNRATNDMQEAEQVAIEDHEIDLGDLVDLTPDTDEWYPVLDAIEIPVSQLAEINGTTPNAHGAAITETIFRLGKGLVMPIVVDDGLHILNGRNRLDFCVRQGIESIRVVTVNAARAKMAHQLLNRLSMDFDAQAIRGRLTFHAQTAAPNARKTLSVGATFALTNWKPSNRFDWSDPEHAKAWVDHYGDSVVDFGAGFGLDAYHMTKCGAHVNWFEPYHKQDLELSREKAGEFLEDLATGRRYRSIFLSNVLNSVPFEADREIVVGICAALATDETIQYATSRHVGALKGMVSVRTTNSCQATGARAIRDMFEPNTAMSNIDTAPHIEKFFTADEFKAPFLQFWNTVEGGVRGGWTWVVCANPRPIDYAKLADALAYEFDMEWPKATFGMVDAAKAAFGERLGKELP